MIVIAIANKKELRNIARISINGKNKANKILYFIGTKDIPEILRLVTFTYM